MSSTRHDPRGSADARSTPRPRLERCRNLTPFAWFKCDKMGPGRRYYDVVVLKGTYVLAPGRLALAPEPASIEVVDTYFEPEEPTRSSVQSAGDVIVTKPSTDVIVTGTARLPRGVIRREWTATVGVFAGSRRVLGSAFRVTGPRTFDYRRMRWRLSDPEPTAEVPIRYERAYGGFYPDPEHAPREGEAHRTIVYPANPSGCGHWDERVLDSARTYRAPQWLDLDAPEVALGAQLPLAGFGPLARWWDARRRFAGTYDQAWKDRARAEAPQGLFPDYPSDFDVRFFQCAHPNLVAPEPLRGDENISLSGLCPDGEHLNAQLPGVRVDVDLIDPRFGVSSHPLPLDTVHVDLDARRVSLTWRLTLLQDFDVQQAVFRMEELS